MNKKEHLFWDALLESGGDLSSRAVSSQVLSALKGLTSVFGMGTGGTPSPLPPEIISFLGAEVVKLSLPSYLPKVLYPLLEVDRCLPAFLQLPPFRLLTFRVTLLAYQVCCVLRFHTPLLAPADTPWQLHIEKTLISLTLVSFALLKSSPRPISINNLHVLPHFQRWPITW